MATLLIRADANDRVGSGHVMRCLALAQQWQDQGGDVCCLMPPGALHLEEKLANEGVRVRHLDAASGSSHDAHEVAAAARAIRADWVVIDGYHFTSEYLDELQCAGLIVAVIDDLALLPSYPCDVVINPNPGAEALPYPCGPNTRLLLGPHYCLLRREFRSLYVEPRSFPDKMPVDLLITMGGADSCNVTARVLHALADLPPSQMDVKVVVGHNNSRESELRDLVATLRLPAVVLSRVTNLGELMAGTDICIAAGGNTCWELAFLGVPMILVTLADNQASTVQAMADRGCAVSLGWYGSLPQASIASAVRELMLDPGRRRDMSDRGRGYIDGRGAERIVSCMKQHVCHA